MTIQENAGSGSNLDNGRIIWDRRNGTCVLSFSFSCHLKASSITNGGPPTVFREIDALWLGWPLWSFVTSIPGTVANTSSGLTFTFDYSATVFDTQGTDETWTFTAAARTVEPPSTTPLKITFDPSTPAQ